MRYRDKIYCVVNKDEKGKKKKLNKYLNKGKIFYNFKFFFNLF